MLWTLIKNNLKLMLRSKWIIAIVVLGPIVTIAALSSAFHNILTTRTSVETFKVGYQAAEECRYTYAMEAMQKKSIDSGVELLNFSGVDTDMDPQSQINDGNVQVFVTLNDETYTIYSREEDEAQAKIVEFMMYQMFHGGDPIAEIPTHSAKFIQIPSAINYYGKIEIVYFMWCSMILLSAVTTSERKNRIGQRLRLAPASSFSLYLAQLIPSFLAIVVVNAAAMVLSTIIFDIEWGCIAATGGMLLLGAAAASTIAVLVFHLIKNTAAAVVFEFVMIWVFGFLGGSFETYMFSTFSEGIKRLSPIYYLNRVLVEFQTEGGSDYVVSAVLVYAAIIGAGMVLGTMVMKRRLGEQ